MIKISISNVEFVVEFYPVESDTMQKGLQTIHKQNNSKCGTSEEIHSDENCRIAVGL